MQSDDLKRMLAAAAAEPSRPLDARAVLNRGARLRRARLAGAATGLAVVVAGASAAPGAFWPVRDRDLGPGPAGTSTAEACDHGFGPALHVVIFLKDEASATQVQALRSDLEQSPDVAHVRYVSPEEAHREAADALKGVSDARPAPVGSMPASFRVKAVSERAARRLSLHVTPAVEDVRTSADAREYLCSRMGLPHDPARRTDRPSSGPDFEHGDTPARGRERKGD